MAKMKKSSDEESGESKQDKEPTEETRSSMKRRTGSRPGKKARIKQLIALGKIPEKERPKEPELASETDKSKAKKDNASKQQKAKAKAKPKTKRKRPDSNEGQEKTKGKTAKLAEDEENLQHRVHVSGLSKKRADEQKLIEQFSVVGDVRSLSFMRNSRGELMGSAFVCFTDAEGATAALNLDGAELGSKTVSVKRALPPPPKFKVSVRDLPYEADEETLKRDWAEPGEFERFKMVKDGSGEFCGEILITYKSQEAVDAALAFNKTEYGGRTIYVSKADAAALARARGKGKGKGMGKAVGSKGKGKGKADRKGRGAKSRK